MKPLILLINFLCQIQTNYLESAGVRGCCLGRLAFFRAEVGRRRSNGPTYMDGGWTVVIFENGSDSEAQLRQAFHAALDVILHVLRLDGPESLENHVISDEHFVVHEAVQPLSVEDPLHLAEASLDGLSLGRVRDVVEGRYPKLPVHLLDELRFVAGQVIQEEGKRFPVVRPTQIPEVPAEIELVDRAVEDLDQINPFFLRHCRYHRPVAGEDLGLIDGQVAVSAAPLLGLQGGLGEVGLVQVQDPELFLLGLGDVLEEGGLPSRVLGRVPLGHDFALPHDLAFDPVLQVEAA